MCAGGHGPSQDDNTYTKDYYVGYSRKFLCEVVLDGLNVMQKNADE